MEKSSSRPTLVKAKTPRSGSPTPVNKNPIPAKNQSFPMAIPKEGGKIRLPAPKNIANKANPKITASLFLFIKITFCRTYLLSNNRRIAHNESVLPFCFAYPYVP